MTFGKAVCLGLPIAQRQSRFYVCHVVGEACLVLWSTGLPPVNRPTLGRLPGCIQDQPSDLVGMGDQRQVTCLYFDGLRAHALGHETFEIGIDRPIFRGNRIESLKEISCIQACTVRTSIGDCIGDSVQYKKRLYWRFCHIVCNVVEIVLAISFILESTKV